MLSEPKASAHIQGKGLDMDDLLDDPELERLHAERLAAMQREAEKRVQLERKGHGELQEVCINDPNSHQLSPAGARHTLSSQPGLSTRQMLLARNPKHKES